MLCKSVNNTCITLSTLLLKNKNKTNKKKPVQIALVNYSTNIDKNEQTYLTSNQWAQHKAMTYGVGNPSPGYGQAQQCSGI